MTSRPFSEVGFPLPSNYRRGLDYTAYEISKLPIATGIEAALIFSLGGAEWPAQVITSAAYYEDKDNFREYLWIDRSKNPTQPWPPARDLQGEGTSLLRPAPNLSLIHI